MKTITIFLILFFCLQLNANSNIIKSADSAYQSQNYLQAIGLYNQALSNYQQSAYLYYNLGNAYYKNNEIG